MIKLHSKDNNRPIWINEDLITVLRPESDETTEIYMVNDSIYTVIGKDATIAQVIAFKGMGIG